MIKSPEKEKQTSIFTDKTPKTSLNKDKPKRISSNTSNQNRNDDFDEESLPKDFYLNDFGDINPKYLKSPKPEIDPLYEKDPKYDTDSEYEKDSEYGDKSPPNSGNEDHGVVAMATEIHGFCFVSGALPIEDFCGNADEDLLAWLQKFEDNFNVSKNASLKQPIKNQVKAKHLIAKLSDPARSRVQALSEADRNSYDIIVAHLKKLYLTEATKVRLMCELQAAYQGKEESVQHFANRVSKLVERINQGVTDPDVIDREKKREFVYKLLPKFMAKMSTRIFASFGDAVEAALQLEQLAVVKRDAEERANRWESQKTNTSKLPEMQNNETQIHYRPLGDNELVVHCFAFLGA